MKDRDLVVSGLARMLALAKFVYFADKAGALQGQGHALADAIAGCAAEVQVGLGMETAADVQEITSAAAALINEANAETAAEQKPANNKLH